MSSSKGILPERFNAWLQRRSLRRSRKNKEKYRRVLDQVMISLADQQLLTGIAVIISGYVRATNERIFNSKLPYILRLQENHFHMIIYMSCLSSSAHLACLITLRRCFSAHSVPALIRLVLVVVFALLLAASFLISWPFGFYMLALYVTYKNFEIRGPDWKLPPSVLALFWTLNALAILFLFYPFWIAIINIFEDFKLKIRERISNLWHTEYRWMPTYWIRTGYHRLHGSGKKTRGCLHKAERLASRIFWSILLGSTRAAFFQQVFFFRVSLAWVLAQKTANSPRKNEMCDLTSTGEGRWGFGQILALLLLAQPMLSGVAAYYGTSRSYFMSTRENLH